MTALVLVVPADLSRPTGGNHYDRAVATALRGLGVAVEERPVPGDWPVAGPAEQRLLAAALRSPHPVLVDGLLACGVPAAVADAGRAGSRVHVLVHMPLGARTGLPPAQADALDALERQALHAATGVLATSRWSAEGLARRHGLTGVPVATPGADPAPPATGSDPPRLLQLASVSPVKDQLTVVEALAALRDLAWTADLTGLDDVDPGYTARVRDAVHRHRLADRVRLTGPLTGPALEPVWTGTDLLLLPSRTETWGLVVTEALARGIPAVVTRGTGAEEALGRAAPDGEAPGRLPGALVPAGDPGALADAVRSLLGDDREAAVAAALERRAGLRSWAGTAQDILEAIVVGEDNR